MEKEQPIIRRFPRLKRRTFTYTKLTVKQRRLARLVAGGMTIKNASRKLGMTVNTYYRYMNYHHLFKEYYLRCSRKIAEEVVGRLDAKLGRAVRVVEESLDHPDYYFAHAAANKFLQGRGIYKKNVESKQQITSNVHLEGQIENIGKPLDKELIGMFVDAMAKMASGQRRIEPKVVKGKTVEKVLNLLPEPAPNVSLDTTIQKGEQQETVRSNQ